MHRAREKWRLVWGKELDQQAAERLSDKEKEYETLWKGFFDSIAIQERKNLRLQKTHLPVRYREGMSEFSD